MIAGFPQRDPSLLCPNLEITYDSFCCSDCSQRPDLAPYWRRPHRARIPDGGNPWGGLRGEAPPIAASSLGLSEPV